MLGQTPQGNLTVDELLTEHLADVDERIAAGKLSGKTRYGYRDVRRFFIRSGLLHMPVAKLGPLHFTALQRCLEMSGRSLRSQSNVVAAVKAIFNWAVAMELIRPVNFGPRFVLPSSVAIEAEREERGVQRFFDRETILAALDASDAKLRLAILLGINCGFYPSDTAAICLKHIHLDGISYHNFRRPKTMQRRMAVLWSETIAAIRDYVDNYRNPIDPNEQHLLISRTGTCYAQCISTSRLVVPFNRLLDSIGGRPPGVSLGSLRHTYATVVDLVPDQAMIDLTMGHASRGLQKRVYRQLNLRELERLQAVAKVVHEWLYNGEN